jgi:hypothetical protein
MLERIVTGGQTGVDQAEYHDTPDDMGMLELTILDLCPSVAPTQPRAPTSHEAPRVSRHPGSCSQNCYLTLFAKLLILTAAGPPPCR